MLPTAYAVSMETPHDKYSSNLWDWLTNGQTTHHIGKRSIGSVVYKIWPFLLKVVGIEVVGTAGGIGLTALIKSAWPTYHFSDQLTDNMGIVSESPSRTRNFLTGNDSSKHSFLCSRRLLSMFRCSMFLSSQISFGFRSYYANTRVKLCMVPHTIK